MEQSDCLARDESESVYIGMRNRMAGRYDECRM
jgi:hypothetical protein